MKTINQNSTYVIVECYKCHVPFGLTDEFQENLRDWGDTFFCPNGHSQAYKTTTIQKLEEKLRREQIEREYAQGLFEAERNSHRTTRGHVTRIKRRVSAGVCPCCNRQFQNLKQHMQGQHPGFKRK